MTWECYHVSNEQWVVSSNFSAVREEKYLEWHSLVSYTQ